MKRSGYTQSILSASYEKSLLAQCQALGLAAYMDEISGLGDESAQKKTDIGRAQMKRLGLDGSDCVLVGDMVADSELADVLGVACVLVPWGHNSEERLAATGRTICRTMEELGKTLLAMK